MAQKFPAQLNALIAHLKKLPGVGTRTAERFGFELITWNEAELTQMAELLQSLK